MVEPMANLPQKKMQVFAGHSAERIEPILGVAADGDRSVRSLAHVVDRQSSDQRGHHRFHLHAGPLQGPDRRDDGDFPAPRIGGEIDRRMVDGDLMEQRDQVRRPLAAAIPASRATPSTSPLVIRPSRTAGNVYGPKTTCASATVVFRIDSFSLTSTMTALPSASKGLNDIRYASVIPTSPRITCTGTSSPVAKTVFSFASTAMPFARTMVVKMPVFWPAAEATQWMPSSTSIRTRKKTPSP